MGGCQHGQTLTTVTAGLARTVCEICGHVSVRYVERAVQLYTIRELLARDGGRAGEVEERRICDLCRQTAIYSTPDGIVCSEHAWQAAAKSSWGGGVDPWDPIPLKITYR